MLNYTNRQGRTIPVRTATPTTLYNDMDRPVAIALPSGTFLEADVTSVETIEQVWDDWQKVEAEIVWDGAKPEFGGHSKGLLR